MIFVGDIAVPHSYRAKFILPKGFFEKNFWGNLEGPIVSLQEEPKEALFNSECSFNILLDELNFVGFSLANNHITDLGNFEQTLKELRKRDIKYNGAGENIEAASTPARVKFGASEVSIFGFGWEVIQCKSASKSTEGTNPLKKEHVISSITNEIQHFPFNKIVVQFHWNYEFELYPQPFDRELAFELVDLGVDAVIGCHSHRVQGVELYKGKPIVYGLGNWLLPYKKFFNGRLKYPEFTKKQLAFEYDPNNREHLIHVFEYNEEEETIILKETTSIESSELIKDLTPFQGLGKEEYKSFFRQNRFQKKALPIFYYSDTHLTFYIKNSFIKVRHAGIKAIYALKSKFMA